jgi:hypothetical protein
MQQHKNDLIVENVIAIVPEKAGSKACNDNECSMFGIKGVFLRKI